MNVGLIKKLAPLILAVGILITSCKQITGEIHFNDVILFNKTTPDCGVVMGLTTVYVVYGKYQGLVSGECVNLHKEIKRYSIKDLLTSYPQFKNAQSIEACNKQQEFFKKEGSYLYDK